MDEFLADGGQVAIIIVAVILVLRELPPLVNKIRNGTTTNEEAARLETIAQQVNDLHRWHDVVDAEGVRLWYVRRSLEDSINKLAGAIESMTDILRTVGNQMTAISDNQRDITKAQRVMADRLGMIEREIEALRPRRWREGDSSI